MLKVFQVSLTPNDAISKPYKPYSTHNEVPKYKSTHLGQRKLLLTELMFLTSVESTATVIYAGAAPCDHIQFLLQCFPQVKFVLVDPAPWSSFFTRCFPALYKLRNNVVCNRYSITPQVTVYHGLFSDDLAHKLGQEFQGSSMVFISDIRPLDVEDQAQGDIVTRNDVVRENMEMQARWFKILQEYCRTTSKGMFKFKPSFDEPVTSYLDGDLYYQPWAPLRSTELRLVVEDSSKNKSYDNKWLEEHMNWYNEVYRNSWASVDLDQRFNRLPDTCYEYAICKAYLETSSFFKDPYEMMKEISKSLQYKDRNFGLLCFENGYEPNRIQQQQMIDKIVRQDCLYSCMKS